LVIPAAITTALTLDGANGTRTIKIKNNKSDVSHIGVYNLVITGLTPQGVAIPTTGGDSSKMTWKLTIYDPCEPPNAVVPALKNSPINYRLGDPKMTSI
jgi:hypothetical protein